jgi:hypothetical protein
VASLVDLSGNWSRAIGKAFVAFGAIEHITVVCMRAIPKDPLQRSTRRFTLSQRIDLLLEILESHPGESAEELAGHLSTARSLAETRNLIAHNPLVFDFYRHADGSLSSREVIAHLHTERRLSLEQAQEFAQAAEELATNLYRVSYAFIAALGAQRSSA